MQVKAQMMAKTRGASKSATVQGANMGRLDSPCGVADATLGTVCDNRSSCHSEPEERMVQGANMGTPRREKMGTPRSPPAKVEATLGIQDVALEGLTEEEKEEKVWRFDCGWAL